MQFANPIWLWGLTGILIPVGIHLLSRKESRIIKIGSIRHLEASHTKQSLNLRLNELLLLAVRCLLIILLALVLSGLHFNIGDVKTERWLLVERGMEKDVEFTSLRDSLQNRGFKVKYLENGFPEINTEKKNGKINYWSLLEELSTIPLEKIVVLSHSYIESFRGKRIAMPGNLTWISLQPSPIQFPAQSIRLAHDSVSVREANSSASETTFKTVNYASNPSEHYFKSGADSILVDNPDTLTITFVTDPEFKRDEQILVASFQAVGEAVPSVFNIQHIGPDQWSTDRETDWLIWLSRKEFPTSTNTNSILFRELTSTNKNILEQKDVSGRTRWIITKRLNEEVALAEKLPLKLAFTLMSKENTDQTISTRDRRVQPDKVLWSKKETSNNKKAASTTSGHTAQLLVTLIFISLLAERLIAFRRNQ